MPNLGGHVMLIGWVYNFHSDWNSWRDFSHKFYVSIIKDFAIRRIQILRCDKNQNEITHKILQTEEEFDKYKLTEVDILHADRKAIRCQLL